MPPRDDPTTLDNAFTEAYLTRRNDEDEVPTALDADYAGPWIISAMLGGWAVHRWWEHPAEGEGPYGLFSDRQAALLAVAALHSRGHRGVFRLNPERDADGFEVFRDAETVGRMAIFDERAAEAMSVLDSLLRDPTGLARLLQAAGPTALRHSGRILAREAPPEQDAASSPAGEPHG